MAISVEKTIHLSEERVAKLGYLVEAHRLSEDQVIERALDVLYSLTDAADDSGDRPGWSSLSEYSLKRVWDNDDDARYDNWRELYGVQPG